MFEKRLSSLQGEEFVTDFRLADNVFTSARIKSGNKVCLWLGVFAFNRATDIVGERHAGV